MVSWNLYDDIRMTSLESFSRTSQAEGIIHSCTQKEKQHSTCQRLTSILNCLFARSAELQLALPIRTRCIDKKAHLYAAVSHFTLLYSIITEEKNPPRGSSSLPAKTLRFVRQKPGVMWWSESAAGAASEAALYCCSAPCKAKGMRQILGGKREEDEMSSDKTFMIA